MSPRADDVAREGTTSTATTTATSISISTSISTSTSTPTATPTSVLDDLRARMQAVLARTALREPPPPPPVDTVELPFASEETAHGLLHRRTFVLASTHRTGRAPIWPARHASPELLALLALDPSLASCAPAGALYLDTETTGLSGGAGTVAFLVGLAFWDERGLVVEQLLVRNLGEEGPMLAHVAARVRQASMLVTFNGKSFDIPLLRTRYVLARLEAPPEPPHLDLVHVARRIHKPRGTACKLTALERDVLGFERKDDVPSGEVSACYLHFLRSGDARALLGVIEHNAWDVVAMAALVGLYGEPLEGSQLEAPDLAGVALTFRRAGRLEEAYAVADRAVLSGGGDAALRVRAELAKVRGDRAQALCDFEALEARVDDAKVRLELVKLYEHYVKAPARALAVLERGVSEEDEARSRRARRLTRKVEAEEERTRQSALPFAVGEVGAASSPGAPPRASVSRSRGARRRS